MTDMPDEIWATRERIGYYSLNKWSPFDNNGKKYIRADHPALAEVEEALKNMASQWNVKEIKDKHVYESCDFEEGYNTLVEKSRQALTALQQLRGRG